MYLNFNSIVCCTCLQINRKTDHTTATKSGISPNDYHSRLYPTGITARRLAMFVNSEYEPVKIGQWKCHLGKLNL